MRIARYATAEGPRVGVVAEDGIHPLAAGLAIDALLGRGLAGILAAGADALVDARPLPLDSVRLLSPVAPRLIRDFTTFEQHVEGMALATGGSSIADDFYAFPPFYTATPHATTGPGDAIPVPPGSERFDLELELAAVIGPGGRDFDAAEARRQIVGYTIFNDWSARDLLFREIRLVLGPAKGKDTANTFGPWITTVDELEPFRTADGLLDLGMRAYVNGELLGSDSYAHAAWTAESCAQLASRGTLLAPGDVLGLGTCGAGCLAEFWGRLGPDSRPALAPGDVVRVEVDGIGYLENTVVAGVAPIPLPAGRRVLRDLDVTLA